MANFESGVSRYIQTAAVVRVAFPVDLKGNEYICCDACQLPQKQQPVRTDKRAAALAGPVCWK